MCKCMQVDIGMNMTISTYVLLCFYCKNVSIISCFPSCGAVFKEIV